MLPEAKQTLITLFLTNTPFAETYINHNIKRSFKKRIFYFFKQGENTYVTLEIRSYVN